MKIILLVAVALLVFQERESIKHFFNPPPDYAASHPGKVILYSTSWCGYCAKTRELFKEHRIDYVEYDIEKSPMARKQYQDLGGQGVPVVLINKEVIKGYDPKRMLKLAKNQ